MDSQTVNQIDFRKYDRWDSEPFAGCEDPEAPCAKWLLERIKKPRKILDVGCGTGIHTRWFNDNGMECLGITINPCEIDKKVHSSVGFGDMCSIPYSDKFFDLVFCLGSLEHTIAPLVALSEFNRVLEADGTLFVDMPHISAMGIVDARYGYHKMVLFPIQMKDLFLKTSFEIIEAQMNDSIKDEIFYTATSQALYIVKKAGDIEWSKK